MTMPNIRKMYVPDDRKEIFDLDLDSADLRIVTWESDCKGMKQLFAEGRKPYVELAREYYHDNTITKKHPSYMAFKKFCHGTNYLGKARSLAPQCGLKVYDCEKLQAWYFNRFPEIKTWQDNFTRSFMATGMVKNAFGYQCKFFDRREGTIINEAIAWIPQSTVGLVINHIWAELDEKYGDLIDILLQVHDSLVGQYDIDKRGMALDVIQSVGNSVAVPYPDLLFIPVGIKTSPISWGDCA